MSRNIIAIILVCCFFAAFAFAGVTATTTVKNQTAVIEDSLLSALYSQSSGATLLLPLLLVFALIALISFTGKQPNVGFIFISAATLIFGIFLIWYSSETNNTSLYNGLEKVLKEAGIKFKKRDVSITVRPNWLCYITLLLGIAAAGVSIPPFHKREKRYQLHQELEPYAYIAPHLIFFVLFFLVPAIYGIYTAFTRWDLYNEPVFIGLSNLKSILIDKENTFYHQFRNGFINTIKHVVYTTPFLIVLPLTVALAMRSKAKGSKFFQSIYYLPSLLSASTVVLTWQYIFKQTYGIMNNFFMSTVDWFTPPYSWIVQVVVTVWWGLGANMVIYQSALAGIPEDLYESASIDGANGWETFWHITIPSMRYPLLYTLITTIVAEFGINAQPEMLFGFNNSGSNAVLMMYIRSTAMQQGIAGIASAMALMLGICIMIVTFFQVRFMRKES